jgi:hypothetical protein
VVKKKKTFVEKLWDNIKDIFYPKNVLAFILPKPKCGYCGVQNAKWKNELVNDFACDECVPRGCSCHLYEKPNKRKSFSIEDYEYKTDKNGRELPCEDWTKLH